LNPVLPYRPGRRTPALARAALRGGPPPRERTRARGVAEGRAARARRSARRDRAAAPHHGRVTGRRALALPGTRGTFPVQLHEGTPRGAETPDRPRCYLSRMPRDIDVVGVWHGAPYQVASVSSTADGVIVACGQAGTHTTHPKTGHRHTKDRSSGTSTVSPVRAERTHVDGAVRQGLMWDRDHEPSPAMSRRPSRRGSQPRS